MSVSEVGRRWTERLRQRNVTHATKPSPRARMQVSPRTSQFPRRGTTAPRLSVGFILARRFTLCAFANFVDVLRLAADEGDRSRPICAGWTVLSDTMSPVASSCGVLVQPTNGSAIPRARLHRRRRRTVDRSPTSAPNMPAICNGQPRQRCRLSEFAPAPSSCTGPG